MVFAGLKPKLKIGGFTDFIKSEKMITIASAILITPIVMALVQNIIAKVPFLRDNFLVGMIIASIVIFILAGMVGGIFQAILLGISAGVILVGIQSTSFAQGLLGRLEGAVP